MKSMTLKRNQRADRAEANWRLLCQIAMASFVITFATVKPASAATTMKTIIEKIISDVIGPIFIAIGVILVAYAIGNLILAFKSGDGDAQARAAQTLGAGAALLVITSMINGLGLVDLITN